MRHSLLILAVVMLVGCKYKSPTVEIADPILEKAIRKELGKQEGELTQADLEKVTILDLRSNQLTEMKGLEKLSQLEVLYLGDNQLTNVKGLEKLSHLTSLDLGGNQLTEVPKGLEKLTKLNRLWLHKNTLTNGKGLEKLAQLEKLNLYNNPALTKAQIDELQEALPKCQIKSNPTK